MSDLLHPQHSAGIPYSRPHSPGVSPPQVGFVGIGSMGFYMARNLATHQSPNAPPLLIWNRSQPKIQKLLEEAGSENVRVAQNLEQIATECDIIITSLANDGVVKSVYEQLTKALSHAPPVRHKIFVETSTTYPTLAGELDNLVSAVPHSNLVTCPVIGAPKAADARQLIIVMSGDYRSKKDVAYLLVPAVGRRVIDLGENLEKAPTCKLIANSMILGSLEILAEAYTLAEKSGIGAENVDSIVKDIFPAPGVMAYSEKMKNDHFDGSAGFTIDGGIKDARWAALLHYCNVISNVSIDSHIRRLTAEHDTPMPLADIAYQHLITARAIHNIMKAEGKEVYDPLDWSAIVASTRIAAGLDAFDSSKHTAVVREE
ncbi:NAD-P-binding protein [Guyanagaster necrorhizus]|uniref:NAD-P-binding protein n=1 Tax=Guyanagaster necrorhizus TaxID=856835 RepID=A0A9P7W4Y3_9AGAR|nr:NAD-P-binding protein [Guyanagaster necrorhizus MCA 3950]KAG7452219.1 NAD-P-binding protein [Guyanagaster necrorhizus MCA 3950]